MKITGFRKIRSLRHVYVEWPSAARRWAKAGSGALALAALWMIAGSCLAIEPPMPAPARSSKGDYPAPSVPAAEVSGKSHLDLVFVEPRGRGPKGFRYRIVLKSAARSAESSLDLAAQEGGLLVTARDVDGAGNDPDLIIKSAWSFTPVGVWINDHHGGFIKADTRAYSPSIWSECPQLLSGNSPDALHGAILVWHQSYHQTVTQRCRGERWTHQAFIELADLHVPSRLTADPQQTRGPPSPYFVKSY